MMNVRQVELMAEIGELKGALGDSTGNSKIGDWKVAKYQEYILAGLEPPYDIVELHQKRQEARDKINELEAELATLTD